MNNRIESDDPSLPVLILGAGGHAGILVDALQSAGVKIIGLTDIHPEKKLPVFGVPVIGHEDMVKDYSPDRIRLVNGVGSEYSMQGRAELYKKFKSFGYTFVSVMHPAAVISRLAFLDEGVQVMAGAVLQAGCHIGENSLVNTNASVDHNCVIGAHVHLAPGVTLSGNVTIADSVHVGTGATIIQKINIGRGSLIAAGAVVIKDVPENSVAMGVPARCRPM